MQPRKEHSRARLIIHGKASPTSRLDLLSSLPDSTPEFVPPMMAKPVSSLPAGEQWRYELKLDGYRALAIKTAADVKLISRNRKDLSESYPELVEAVRSLPMREGVLDGEIVAVDGAGKPSFQSLQHLARFGRAARPILYFAFDLLNLNGKNLVSLPLLERKRLLEQLLAGAPSRVRFAGFLEGEVDAIVAAVCQHNLEGIVAKLATSRYEPDKRSGAWVKLKCGYRQDFVIGGYTRGSGGRSAFGALIVGYYHEGKLQYASKVGTGFNNAFVRQIIKASEQLRQDASPFEAIPESAGTSWSYGLTAAERRMAVWLRPVLACRVRFTEWTRDGHLRHPCFEGMRLEGEGGAAKNLSKTPCDLSQQSGAC